MKTNVKNQLAVFTHAGGISAANLSPAQQLRRTVMCMMLFEDNFYESGVAASERVRDLLRKVSFEDAAQIAIDAREKMKLRHAPLFIVREMLRYHTGRKVGDLIHDVIQRPDEITELLALYWKDGKDQPLTAQLKIGLARAFGKFNEYQLAKYNRDGAVKLRDALFLCHARPKTLEGAEALPFTKLFRKGLTLGDHIGVRPNGLSTDELLYGKVAHNMLTTPDTWEVELSGGADKAETFTRLMTEKKLGALALLRNLRGMLEAGVVEDVIRTAIKDMNAERVLPFRFIAAARYAPRLEDVLELAMFRCLTEQPKLVGKTALLIDHSGSMNERVSAKSEITRFDAASGVAMILRECCDNVRFFAFSTSTVEVPARRGFALKDAALNSMAFGGTDLSQAVNHVYAAMPDCERLIVLTDEQSGTKPSHPHGHGYIINVAGYKNGIGYGPWVTIDGWSEAIVDYIRATEENQEIC